MSNSNAVSVLYTKLVEVGKVIEDHGQLNAISALDNLYNQIISKINLKNIFSNKKIMGVYIYGRVGRGKSYLMDLFYKLVQNKRCMRLHQHDFMKNIHEHMKKARLSNHKNPLKVAVDKLTKEINILCVDEFEVLDVADAMILERIYQILLKNNIKVVLTSNTVPSNLYKNGLQRERFIPFISLVEKHFDIREVSEGKDYRIKTSKALGIHEFQDFYYLPANKKLHEKLFNILRDGKQIKSIDLEYNQRRTKIEKIANRVSIFSFEQLCGTNLSTIDYYQIVNVSDWLIIIDVPELNSNDRNKAKRFQILLDILYDKKIGLTLSSNIKPENIYIEGDGFKEFRRTISRIYEMTNKEWLDKIKNKDFKKLLSL